MWYVTGGGCLFMNSGIYKILHKDSGRCYIGSAENIEDRWNKHRWMLENGRHDNVHLQRAWVLYGPDAFEFLVINNVPIEDLLTTEQYWIDKYNSIDPRYGFNICSVAGTRRHVPQSLETRQKISAAQFGRKHKPETILKMKSHIGSSKAGAKLTEKIVMDIKVSLKSGVTHKSIANKYGVSRSTITEISRGSNWGHIKVPA